MRDGAAIDVDLERSAVIAGVQFGGEIAGGVGVELAQQRSLFRADLISVEHVEGGFWISNCKPGYVLLGPQTIQPYFNSGQELLAVSAQYTAQVAAEYVAGHSSPSDLATHLRRNL